MRCGGRFGDLGRRWLGPFGGSGVRHKLFRNNTLLEVSINYAVNLTNIIHPKKPTASISEANLHCHPLNLRDHIISNSAISYEHSSLYEPKNNTFASIRNHDILQSLYKPIPLAPMQ
ncbi:hypothetical protein EC845_1973 [Comamonas sp. BIGb0124]|nr:hypothetical protein EC845_1973 [Comamonas sp. BIGb0124]